MNQQPRDATNCSGNSLSGGWPEGWSARSRDRWLRLGLSPDQACHWDSQGWRPAALMQADKFRDALGATWLAALQGVSALSPVPGHSFAELVYREARNLPSRKPGHLFPGDYFQILNVRPNAVADVETVYRDRGRWWLSKTPYPTDHATPLADQSHTLNEVLAAHPDLLTMGDDLVIVNSKGLSTHEVLAFLTPPSRASEPCDPSIWDDDPAFQDFLWEHGAPSEILHLYLPDGWSMEERFMSVHGKTAVVLETDTERVLFLLEPEMENAAAFLTQQLYKASWFSEGTFGPVSWGGSKVLGFCGERLIVEQPEGDSDGAPVSVWLRQPDETPRDLVLAELIRHDEAAASVIVKTFGFPRLHDSHAFAFEPVAENLGWLSVHFGLSRADTEWVVSQLLASNPR